MFLFYLSMAKKLVSNKILSFSFDTTDWIEVAGENSTRLCFYRWMSGIVLHEYGEFILLMKHQLQMDHVDQMSPPNLLD